MIYSLRGKLIHTEPGITVVECGGVGFKCFTSYITQRELSARGAEVMLYTHMNVREDAMDLFGFSTEDELSSFRLLTSVSGVGPKAGIAILSELSPDRLAAAIASGDVKAITRAQGVGPKIAQRIISELKDKVSPKNSQETDIIYRGGTETAVRSNMSEAIKALTVLGYQADDVAPVVSGLDSSLTVEQLISTTLRILAGGK